MKLTQKQENFVLNYFELGNATEAALIAGYSPKTAYVIASENLTKPKILARLQELRDKAESDKVMPVQERKERLSEIARARLIDYQEAGLDGAGYISITKDSPNTAAISQMESATKFDEHGNTGTLFIRVKLHSPIQAIDLLNKMDKIYSDTVINIDNRKVEISGLTDEQLEQIANRALSGSPRVIVEKTSS